MNVICTDLNCTKQIPTMPAHFSDRSFNDGAFGAIQCNTGILEFCFLVFDQLDVRGHIRRAVNIVFPTIYRTTLITVKPSAVTAESD